MASTTPRRLSHLRSLMTAHNVHALVIPHADAHQSEYLAPSEERLAFISNFTGSSGTAVVTSHRALLWTDGRYFVQAANELDAAHWELVKAGEPNVPTVEKWVLDNLGSSAPNAIKQPRLVQRVGIEAATASIRMASRLERELKKDFDIELCVLQKSFLDQVWGAQRIQRPCGPVTQQPLALCGKSHETKLAEAAAAMRAKQVEHLIVCALDDVAWALNLRGTDIPFNPVFFANLIVASNGTAFLFTDNKVPALGPTVTVAPYDHFLTFTREKVHGRGKVWLDPLTTSCAVLEALGLPLESVEDSPAVHAAPTHFRLCKPIKCAEEIAAVKSAQRIDALALCRFLAWVDAGGFRDELQAAAHLEQLRKRNSSYLGPSFETISSIGANGAVVHYKPTPATNSLAGNCLLVDSGGQYPGGTTDTTRTVWLERPIPLGFPALETVAESYTTVLRSHIALALAHFPAGITAHRLDSIARAPLWRAGKDYKHGTGHGVGAQLCVHETPTISSQCPEINFGVVPGVLLTNEPGYYENGAYGIRIENLMLCVEASSGFVKFETLTKVPLCRRLIVKSMLTAEEVRWVDEYHVQCLAEVKAALEVEADSATLEWVVQATRAL